MGVCMSCGFRMFYARRVAIVLVLLGDFSIMEIRVLASAVLLVVCIVVCACQEKEQPLTTSQLRRQLNRAMHAMVVTVFEMFTPGYTPSHPASSCKEILQLAPQSTSGLYWISGTDNRPRQMYCDMERSCKGVAGGWMRVASIDMTDNSSTCPSGPRTLTSPLRLCTLMVVDALQLCCQYRE